MFPSLAHGTVVSVDTDKRLLTVSVPSAQIIGLRVKVGHQGYADGLRVSQRPLPKPGTSGLIAFPYGDSRNGVWICSLYLGDIDAIHTGDADADYEAHWSGAWSLMQGDGSYFRQFADGTSISAAASTEVPATSRQVVDAGQNRVSVPYGPRVGRAPAPRALQVNHASGAVVDITAAGSVSVAPAKGQPVTFTVGQMTLTLLGDGSVTLALASGGSFQISSGGGSAADMLVKVTELVAWLLAHTHKDNGAGTPNQTLTAAQIGSALVSVTA